MRVLFNNLVADATIYATNESANYPSADLGHPFIKRRFQSTATTSTITIELDADSSINSFFYAFHNLTAITVRLLDSLDATQKTVTITDINDIGIEYFTTETGIRKIEIDITASTFAFLGSFGCGVYYQMPDFLSGFTLGGEDNSIISSSPYGQTLNEQITPLRSEDYGFRDMTIDTKDEIQLNYKTYGKGPFFIDLTEDDRTFLDPIYAYIVDFITMQKNGRRYDAAIKLLEAN